MTLTAGSLDVASLLATAKEPLTMIDAAMQDATEAQAQELAKAHTEVATARALVVVSGECARWYKAFTDETKRASDLEAAARQAVAEAGELRTRAELRQQELEAEVARLTKMVSPPPPADRRSIQLH